jgi:hypothetical protein
MNPSSFSYIGIGIAVAFFLLMGLFFAINELGLKEFTTEATVLEKQYTPSGSTYRTTVINNQTIVQPQGTDEIFAARFDVGGVDQLGLLSQEQFEGLEIGKRVIITARKKRITQDMQIVNVSY